MFYLNVIDTFSAAHRLCGYQGPCSNLHGHNWKVRVCVKTEHQDEIGMSLDFGFLKSMLSAILKDLDHRFLNEVEAVSYTHLRAHETVLDLVCRLLLEKKKKT